jgi:Zyg-11 family protein
MYLYFVRNVNKFIDCHLLVVMLCFVFGSAYKFTLSLQLQKNSLLRLDSKRILQAVEFDKYRCARLVMNCLCNFDDPSMNEMGVVICMTLGKLVA